MINPTQANSSSIVWPQCLTGAVKAIWRTARRRPAQPAFARPVAESKAVLLTVRAFLPPAQTTVVCLAVEGTLNRHTYMSLIDMACAHYHQGRRRLLLDLRQTTQIELSGIFALLNIARLYSDQSLLDPEAGWAGLHQIAEDVTPALGERVKLLAPSPAAASALEQASFCRFFTCYPDLDTALSTISQ
jgi:hypothetical protein